MEVEKRRGFTLIEPLTAIAISRGDTVSRLPPHVSEVKQQSSKQHELSSNNPPSIVDAGRRGRRIRRSDRKDRRCRTGETEHGG